MSFHKIYLLATIVTGMFAVISLLNGFNNYALLVLIFLGVPLILPLSIKSGDRFAFVISLIFTGLSTVFLISCCMMFSKAESLSDFEGPNGESPIAPVIGVFMFAIFFMIPWSIASIRGYKNLKITGRNNEEGSGGEERTSDCGQ